MTPNMRPDNAMTGGIFFLGGTSITSDVYELELGVIPTDGFETIQSHTAGSDFVRKTEDNLGKPTVSFMDK